MNLQPIKSMVAQKEQQEKEKIKYMKREWSVDGFNTTSVIEKQENDSYKHVCTCNYGYTKPSDNFKINEANAKLIAAAPDLLNALMTLKPLYDGRNNEYERIINEAIKKATE